MTITNEQYNVIISDILCSIVDMNYNNIKINSEILNILTDMLKGFDPYWYLFHKKNGINRWCSLLNDTDNVFIYLFHKIDINRILRSLRFWYDEKFNKIEERMLRDSIYEIFPKDKIQNIYEKYYKECNKIKYNNYIGYCKSACVNLDLAIMEYCDVSNLELLMYYFKVEIF